MNLRVLLSLLFLFAAARGYGQDFTSVSFGDDFLSIGGGARALGMGSAHAAVANDVTAGYWNVAGLASIQHIQASYMHSERFSGVVNYDYGAVALPIEENNSVVAISFFRQGVDNIKNTLNAFDSDRQLPTADPTNFFAEFSARDMAFFLSYATSPTEGFSWGATAKLLNSRLGPFADAWGYSIDLGMLVRSDFVNWGINLQNITSLMKFWDTNPQTLQPLAETFNDAIPEGQNERTPPTVKFGLSKDLAFSDFAVLVASDVDIRFEGREEFYINLGKMSFEPHVGTELAYKDVVSIRAGLTDFFNDFDGNMSVSPTFGAGLRFEMLSLDYSFSNFSGVSSVLGNTHRISLLLRFNNLSGSR